MILVDDREERFGKVEVLGVAVLGGLADLDVVDALADGEGGVRDERPRRRRPCEEVGVGLALDGEADVDRRVLRFLIAERDLVRREHGAAAGAVPLDLVALVEERLALGRPLLGDPLDQVPDRLDVVVFECDVRVVHVDPVAHPPREVVPQVFVAEDALPALRVVFGDAVLLDLVPPFQPEFFLHLDLDGEAVCIPPGLAVDAEPLHRLVAAEEVLDRPRHHVVDARLAVGRRRALVEHEVRGALAELQALSEHVVRVPPPEGLFLGGGVVESFDVGVTGHGTGGERSRSRKEA